MLILGVDECANAGRYRSVNWRYRLISVFCVYRLYAYTSCDIHVDRTCCKVNDSAIVGGHRCRVVGPLFY